MARDVQIVDLPAGAQRDLYFEINVKGKVYIKIAAADRSRACASFWWIKWPFGSVHHLGQHCDFAEFDIPGLISGAISAKLRVGGASKHLKLVLSADEQVARNATITF